MAANQTRVMEAMRVPDKYISVERAEMLRIRVDTVPEDTIATSPDDAAAKAIAMQGLSKEHENRWGFRVEYFA